ncbi:bolA-like protein 2 isoform X3 [Daphnia pulex]|nr:bolA-like protein 2 isoform X3 [Daphnia pulex]
MANLTEALRLKLQTTLETVHCEVEDLSDGCGAKISVIVVSKQFEGKPLLQRHRLVNSVLEEELKSIHAFSQKTLTPEQWEKLKNQPSESS